VTVLDQGELPEGAVEDGAPLHLTTDCVIPNGALGLIGWIGEPRVPIASFTGDAGPDGFDRVAAYAEALEDGGFGLAVDNVVVSAGDDYRPTLEGELRSHVPPAIAAGCAETPTSIAEEGALFAIACPGENPGAEIFEYTLFNSRAAMEAAYQQRVTTYGATQNANDCSTGPDEDGYTIDGTPAGRVFCAAQQFGIRIDWTDTRLNILASATDFDGSYPDTHADWLTAGPDLQPRTAVVH
jgi:hypothetical protein